MVVLLLVKLSFCTMELLSKMLLVLPKLLMDSEHETIGYKCSQCANDCMKFGRLLPLFGFGVPVLNW
jgi:hypothetical protein